MSRMGLASHFLPPHPSKVNANVLGEAFEDPALCALRGTASCGHVGLWPAAAMLNHSCSPNAVAYAIGDRLVSTREPARQQDRNGCER